MQSSNSFKKKINYKNTQGGQVMIVAVVFFILISLAIISGIVSPTVREFKISTDTLLSRQSYFLAESGGEDALYRLRNAVTIGSTENITLNGNTVSTTLTSPTGSTRVVTSVSDVTSRKRTSELKLASTDGISFQYAMQAGDGGINLQNSATVMGSTFSNGPITGTATNSIQGDVISAGSDGSISNIFSTASSRAHAITTSVVSTDAYYQSIDGFTRVSGTPCPNAHCYQLGSDTQDIPLVITDATLDQWETNANAGGSVTCTPNNSSGTYTISSNQTIGPRKIPCNLAISGSAVVTLTGPLWVSGNMTMSGTSSIAISATYPTESFAIVVDNPSNHTTSSQVTISRTGGSQAFSGGGGSGSYVAIASRHDYVASGGTNAITIVNAITGALIAYTRSGNIEVQQNATLGEISGYKVTAKNSAQLLFIGGGADPNFSSSAQNGWNSTAWKEIE